MSCIYKCARKRENLCERMIIRVKALRRAHLFVAAPAAATVISKWSEEHKGTRIRNVMVLSAEGSGNRRGAARRCGGGEWRRKSRGFGRRPGLGTGTLSDIACAGAAPAPHSPDSAGRRKRAAAQPAATLHHMIAMLHAALVRPYRRPARRIISDRVRPGLNRRSARATRIPGRSGAVSESGPDAAAVSCGPSMGRRAARKSLASPSRSPFRIAWRFSASRSCGGRRARTKGVSEPLGRGGIN